MKTTTMSEEENKPTEEDRKFQLRLPAGATHPSIEDEADADEETKKKEENK